MIPTLKGSPRAGSTMVRVSIEMSPELLAEVNAVLAVHRFTDDKPSGTAMLRVLVTRGLRSTEHTSALIRCREAARKGAYGTVVEIVDDALKETT